jgi:molecular chaperone IbpA
MALHINTHPYFIGFEQTFDHLKQMQENMAKQVTGYPPYNISKVSENKYLIEMAVAGFAKQDIEIELEESVLKVKGKLETMDQLTADGVDKTYLHKGIADRAFTRQFTLADNVEVQNAKLLNGMLKIYLEHIIPDYKKPKKVHIDDKETGPPEFLAEDLKI